ncbi:MAG: hypothetical protein ACREL3_08825 [Gemmatimonadales bacterium]
MAHHEEQQEKELTVTEAGRVIARSSYQVVRLIMLGQLRARRDSRGWWRVEAVSAREYVERRGTPAGTAA